MDGRWITTEAEADEFLSRHQSVELEYRRRRDGSGRGWIAAIAGTDVSPLPHSPMPLAKLKLTLATRYLAECYDDRAFVDLHWARNVPNFHGPLHALPELAAAILRVEDEAAAAATAN